MFWLLVPLLAGAQVQVPGIYHHSSFTELFRNYPTDQYLKLPPIDNEALESMAEDADNSFEPRWFAHAVNMTNANLHTMGVWSTLNYTVSQLRRNTPKQRFNTNDDKKEAKEESMKEDLKEDDNKDEEVHLRVWTLGVWSPGAISLSFLFDDFYLPPRGEFYVVGQERIAGAFTGPINNKDDMHFAVAPMLGDLCFLEYVEPLSDVPTTAHIDIFKVVHGFRNLYRMHVPPPLAIPGDGFHERDKLPRRLVAKIEKQ